MVYGGKAKLRMVDEERMVEKGGFYRVPANVLRRDTAIGDDPIIMPWHILSSRQDFIEEWR